MARTILLIFMWITSIIFAWHFAKGFIYQLKEFIKAKKAKQQNKKKGD